MLGVIWTALEITGYALALVAFMLVCALGVVLTALQLPGTWLIVLATGLVAWWRWDQQTIGWYALAAVLGLAILGEVLEFIAGALGARTAGASKRAAAIAIVGGVIGAIAGTPLIPIPIVGTLVGAAIGAGLGSVLGDKWAGRQWGEALKGGQGAAIGKLGGSVAKLTVAVLMWFVAVGAAVLP